MLIIVERSIDSLNLKMWFHLYKSEQHNTTYGEEQHLLYISCTRMNNTEDQLSLEVRIML